MQHIFLNLKHERPDEPVIFTNRNHLLSERMPFYYPCLSKDIIMRWNWCLALAKRAQA